jgi:hypothetical protein
MSRIPAALHFPSQDGVQRGWPRPSERVESFTDLPVDRDITIMEGAGIK